MALKRSIDAEERVAKKPFNTECPSCFENGETVLPCNHSICEECLKGISMSLKPHCPLCRSEINLPRVLEWQGYAAHERGYLSLAFKCYKGAAEGGVVSVMKYLSYFFKHGIGCTQNTVLAEVWLQRAIDGGDLDAVYNRGVNYFNIGEYETAQKWFTEAGLKGHRKSMKTLIFMHENKFGTACIAWADFWSKKLYPDGPERTKYEEAAEREWDESDEEGPLSL